MEQGFSDEPLDIGQVTLEIIDSSAIPDAPNAGAAFSSKPAADFDLPGLNGSKIKLSDHKGKVILLVVYFPPQEINQPSDKLAGIKEISDSFANYQNFVTLGLTMDYNLRCAKDFAAEHNFNWPTALLDIKKLQVSQSGVVKDYNLIGTTSPVVILIGADGLIKARTTDKQQLTNAINNELGL